MDPVTIRVTAEVSRALTEIDTLRRKWIQFGTDFQKVGAQVNHAMAALSGDNLIRQSQAYLQVVKQIGGVTKLTANEKKNLLNLLNETVAKYQALGQSVPRAVSTVHTQLKKWSDAQKQVAEQVKATQAAQAAAARQAAAEQRRVTGITSMFSGDKAIRDAKLYLEAVRQAGGVTRLTATEQQKLNRVVAEGAEKYRLMTGQAHRGMQEVLAQTRKVTTEGSNFFGSFFQRIAGGTAAGYVLANGLIRAFDMIKRAGIAAFTEIFNLIDRGATFQGIERAFGALTRAAGLNSEELIRLTRDASEGLVSNFKIIESANRAMLFGLQLTEAQFADLTRSAIALGQAMNLDAERSIERLTLALGRLSPRILDDLGIIVKLADANQEWAKAHGKTVQQMSGEEKILAFQAKALEKIKQHVDSLGGIYLTLGSKIKQVQVDWQNFYDQLAKAVSLSPVLNQAFNTLGTVLRSTFGENTEAIISQIVTLIEEAAIKAVKLGAFFADTGKVVLKVSGGMVYSFIGVNKAIAGMLESMMEIPLSQARFMKAHPLLSWIPGAEAAAIAMEDMALRTKKSMSETFRFLDQEQKDAFNRATGIGPWHEALNFASDTLHKIAGQMEGARGQVVKTNPVLDTFVKKLLSLENPNIDETLSDVTESLDKRMAKLNVQLEGAFRNHVSNEDIAKKHGAAIRSITIEAQELGKRLPEALQRANKVLLELDIEEWKAKNHQEMREAGEDLAKAFFEGQQEHGIDLMKNFLDNQEVLEQTLRDIEDVQVDMQEDSLQKRLRMVEIEVARRKDALKKTSSNYAMASKEIDRWGEWTTKQVTAEWQKHVFEMGKSTNDYVDLFAQSFGQIGEIIARSLNPASGGFKNAIKSLGRFAEEIGGKIGAKLFSGQTIGQSIVGKMNQWFGADFAAGFAKFLGPLGDMVGQMAVNLGARLVDALWKTTEEKIQSDVFRDWHIKVSDELAKKIAEDAERLGDRYSASLLHMKAIVEEAGGITRGNVKTWIARARDLFVMLETNMITTQEAGKALNEIWPDLEKAIDKMTGLASRDLIELTQLAKRFGVEVEGITNFINEQTEFIVGGFNAIATGMTFSWLNSPDAKDANKTLTDIAERTQELNDIISELEGKQYLSGNQRVALRDAKRELAQLERQAEMARAKLDAAREAMGATAITSQEEFSRYGRLANVALQAGLANGARLVDIIGELGPGLDALVEAQKAYGFEVDASFGDLLAIRSFVKEHEQLAGVITGVNDMAKGLHNTNQITEQTYLDLAATAHDAMAQMTAEGLSVDQAMRLMQPTLQTLYELQKQHNFALADSVQLLLDQAKSGGIIGDQFISAQDRMVTGIEKVATLLEKIAEKWGVSMEGVVDPLVNGLSEVEREILGQDERINNWRDKFVREAFRIKQAVDEVSFGSSPGGLKEIPIKLQEGMEAFTRFEAVALQAMGNVKRDLDGIASLLSGVMSGQLSADGLTQDAENTYRGIMESQNKTTVIESGAVQISTWNIEEQERVEQLMTKSMLRVIAKNQGETYSETQDLVRGMVTGL